MFIRIDNNYTIDQDNNNQITLNQQKLELPQARKNLDQLYSNFIKLAGQKNLGAEKNERYEEMDRDYLQWVYRLKKLRGRVNMLINLRRMTSSLAKIYKHIAGMTTTLSLCTHSK